jgi:hypothetical protein
MIAQDLLYKLHDQPFQPFRVRLSNNQTLDVVDPGTVVVGPSSAIMPLETTVAEYGYHLVKRWRSVALSHIAEFIDIDPPKSHGRRKKAS